VEIDLSLDLQNVRAGFLGVMDFHAVLINRRPGGWEGECCAHEPDSRER
jgi:hypothetical protein